MTAPDSYPLLGGDLSLPIAWNTRELISREAFLADVMALAKTLPSRPYAVNLCEDRYRFMTAFAAVLVRGQTNLLPASRTRNTVAEVAERYADCYSLVEDEDVAGAPAPHRVTLKPGSGARVGAPVPHIAGEHPAAIVFTSGSTGRAKPNAKSWGALATGIELGVRRFALDDGREHAIVGTVPPQHMYGLESTVLYPLFSTAAVFTGRPFYPEDVRRALSRAPSAPLLVTTPVHLRVCVEAGLQWPALEGIICATAPLDPDLAARAEERFKAPVREIYGCTETGAIASRRTCEDGVWLLYDGMDMQIDQDEAWVTGPQLAEPTPLQDVIRLRADAHFELIGRRSDMINIAGKRASLQDLNLKLNAIAGVEDGVFVSPEETGEGVARLAALVVAPGLDEKSILAQLGESLDPVFLPRPLLRVACLPRSQTGKLPRRALLDLLEAARGDS